MSRASMSKVALTALAIATTTLIPTQSKAYPVDCAILLCLAGGWPASAECSHARAVFIRRITPWPIEPPLQIWRCPMRASFLQDKTPTERLWNISGSRTPLVPSQLATLANNEAVVLTQSISDETGAADIDISGYEFDFVRSIKVWNVMYYSHRERGRDDDCSESYNIQLGAYGSQGEFAWRRAEPSEVPTWVGIDRRCRSGNFYRGVGVEWQDHENTHGYEVVRY